VRPDPSDVSHQIVDWEPAALRIGSIAETHGFPGIRREKPS